MNLNDAVLRLMRDRVAITALIADIDDAQVRWKPAPEEWSLLEVIGHLYDEEREDFRPRLDILLHRPDAPWPPIDPVNSVREHRYNKRDPDEVLDAFGNERDVSLAWLRSLRSPDWTATARTPSGSTISAAEMLHAWLAHDMLHIRQMAELHHKFIAASIAPSSIEYAGEW